MAAMRLKRQLYRTIMEANFLTLIIAPDKMAAPLSVSLASPLCRAFNHKAKVRTVEDVVTTAARRRSSSCRSPPTLTLRQKETS